MLNINKMKNIIRSIFIITTFLLISCSEENFSIEENIVAPTTYSFTRGNESTVSFLDQKTYIAMAEELIDALLVETNTEASLKALFDHVEGSSDFSDVTLNASTLNIRNNVANSIDYFPEGEEDIIAVDIKESFDGWLSAQATGVFVNFETEASPNIAGALTQEADQIIRYVDTSGVEINEYFKKALVGGLLVDQILNNHLSGSLLDNDANIRENDEDVLAEGEVYTNMEHEWDQAYGYLYGAELDPSLPTYGIDGDGADMFLNELLKEVDTNASFTGIANETFEAFKLGRAAIVGKNYDVREEQGEIIRENISKVIGAGAIFYLELGASTLEAEETTDYALAFHQISQGLGLIYSLQFTRKPLIDTPTPYFTKTEVEDFLNRLISTGNGLWEGETTITTLRAIATEINTEFDFSTTEAN